MSSTRNIIRDIVCPGGWHFPVEGRGPITAMGPEELEQKMLEYRIENGLPVGNIRLDLQNYVCGNWPHMCQDGTAAPMSAQHSQSTIPTAEGVRLVDRLMHFLTVCYERWGAEPLVHLPEAERRAEICAACSQNVEWREGCSACVGNAERMGTLVRQGKDSQRWRNLRACNSLGLCCRTAIWVQRKVLGDASAAPDNCWIKQEALT